MFDIVIFYTCVNRCPVPLCKTPKRKVKRLRPLPPKWSELSAESKDPIIKELRKRKDSLHISLLHPEIIGERIK